MADEANIQSYLEAIIDAKITGVLESMFKRIDVQSQQISNDVQSQQISNLQTSVLDYQSRISSLETQNTDLVNRILNLEEHAILLCNILT